MAKIAIMFLLVALFAICHGHRIVRDDPQTPEKLFEEIRSTVEELWTLGEKLANFAEDFVNDVKNNLPKGN